MPALASVVGGAIAGAAGSIASQGFSVVAGLQDKFDWKAVGMAALSAGVGAGVGPPTSQTFIQGAIRGAQASVITQGVAVATGLQDEFDWADVAVQAIGGGINAKVQDMMNPPVQNSSGQWAPTHGPGTAGAFAADLVSGFVGGLAGAGARSLVEGSDFGDNLMNALPGIIGNTIGNAIAGGIQARGARRGLTETKILASPPSPSGKVATDARAASEADANVPVSDALRYRQRLQMNIEVLESAGFVIEKERGGLSISHPDGIEEALNFMEARGQITFGRDEVQMIDQDTRFIRTRYDGPGEGGVIIQYDDAQANGIASTWVVFNGDESAFRILQSDDYSFLYVDGVERFPKLEATLSYGRRPAAGSSYSPVISDERLESLARELERSGRAGYSVGDLEVRIFAPGARIGPVYRNGDDFRQSARYAIVNEGYDAVVNGTFFGFGMRPVDGVGYAGSLVGALNDIDRMEWGPVVENGRIVHGQSSPAHAYFAMLEDGNGSVSFQAGIGDPPAAAIFGFGRATPMIIDGIPYGLGDLDWASAYDDEVNGDYGSGKTIIAYSYRSGQLSVLVQRNYTNRGFSLNQIHGYLIASGFGQAVINDGRSSSRLMERMGAIVHGTVDHLNSTKDGSNPFGIGVWGS